MKETKGRRESEATRKDEAWMIQTAVLYDRSLNNLKRAGLVDKKTETSWIAI